MNRSVLLGATAAIGLMTACAPRSSCRTKPFRWAPIGRHFRHHRLATPTLRAITYRLNLRCSDTVVTYRRSIKMRLLRYWDRGRHDWRSIRLRVRKTIC